MSRRLIPMGSNVLVMQKSKEEITREGIVLPDHDPDKRRDYKYGLVLEVGDGYDTLTMHQADVYAHYKEINQPPPWKVQVPKQLRPGDHVMVNSYGIEKTKMRGKELFLIGKVHIAAKVEEVVCRSCDGDGRVSEMVGTVKPEEAQKCLCTLCWAEYLVGVKGAKPQETGIDTGRS